MRLMQILQGKTKKLSKKPRSSRAIPLFGLMFARKGGMLTV